MAKELKFVLEMKGESELLDLFISRLVGGVSFDFEYLLPDMGSPVTIKDQVLCTNEDFSPIRLETRGVGSHAKEMLVITTQDNDLLMSMAERRRPLKIDMTKDKEGIIKITNADDEVYRLIIKLM
jgi:hypothetical protein